MQTPSPFLNRVKPGDALRLQSVEYHCLWWSTSIARSLTHTYVWHWMQRPSTLCSTKAEPVQACNYVPCLFCPCTPQHPQLCGLPCSLSCSPLRGSV